MQPPEVSIVIVSTSDGPLLRGCLERLAGVRTSISFETIMVVNGGSAVELPGARVLATSVNLGLAGALNHARARARGEFIVSLHDDAEPRDGWLDALVGVVREDPSVGAVGSLVLNPDGSLQAAGQEILPDGTTRPPAERPTERIAVDYAPSCSLLIRASSWDQIGGADERFFPLYYVDADICVALRASGQRVLCEPASVVIHRRGSSTASDFGRFVIIRNRLLFLEKWGELLAAHPAGSGRVFSPPIAQLPPREAAADGDERERTALLRSASTGQAFADQLRGELSARNAALADARAEAADARAALTRTREQLAAVEAELGRLREALPAAKDELSWLRMRAETLARIEAGGWWRLRQRLLPLLRVARRALRRE